MRATTRCRYGDWASTARYPAMWTGFIGHVLDGRKPLNSRGPTARSGPSQLTPRSPCPGLILALLADEVSPQIRVQERRGLGLVAREEVAVEVERDGDGAMSHVPAERVGVDAGGDRHRGVE